MTTDDEDHDEDAGDLEAQLGELVLIAAGGRALLREAIAELDREDAEGVLALAVTIFASLKEAQLLRVPGPDEGRTDGDEELPAEDVEELPAEELPADPFVTAESALASALQTARMLREAVVDQRDVAGLLAALDALSDTEAVVIILEMGLHALWRRRLDDGAGAGR
jgi:hypothetical protein